LDVEAGDHRRYADGTFLFMILILLAGIVRFVGLGINNRVLYLLGGIALMFCVALYQVFSKIPKKSRRIES
ncbi:MAG: ATP-binding protein, partial [Nostocaceae cyanobacterium]|nr:ATP-binding protein [Nostocaceae cyanobacterium]